MKISQDRVFKYQLIALFLVVTVLMSFAGYYYFRSERKIVQTEKYNELKAISQLKVNQLVQWRKERLSEANFFSKSLPYPNYTMAIMSGNKPSVKPFIKALQGIMSDGRYDNIFVVDKNGKEIISVVPDHTVIDSTLKGIVKEVCSTGVIQIRDFYFCKTDKKVHLEIVAPVVHQKYGIIAALVMRVEPDDYLHPLIQKWPTPSKTAESYIVRKDNDSIVFLSSLKKSGNLESLSLKKSVIDTNNSAVRVVAGKNDIPESYNYSNGKVLYVGHKVENTPWYMISEIETTEIYKDLNKRIFLVVLLSISIILTVGAVTAWMYNYRQRFTFQKLLQKSGELHHSQTEFSATLYSIGDGVITTDVNGNVKQMNPVAKSMTGWRERNAKGRNIDEVCQFINEENKSIVPNGVMKIIQTGSESIITKRVFLLSKNGEETPISAVVTPINDKNGQFLGTVMVIRDHSKDRFKRLLVETRLKLFEFSTNHNLEETITKILDEIGELSQSPIGFFHFVMPNQETISLQTWSTKTKEMFCNASDVDYEHYSLSRAGVWADCIRERKPIIHNNYKSLEGKKGLPEGHAELLREIVVPVMRNNLIVAVLGVGNKSTEYNDNDIEIISYLADVTWEITEAKRMEETLRENEERIRLLFNSTAEGIYGIDTNGNCIFCNNASLQILGYSSEEDLLGQNMHNLIHYKHNDGSDFDVNQCKVYQAFRDGSHCHVDDEVLWRKNGESFFAEYWSYPIISKGKIIGSVVTFVDITQRKRDEEIQQVLYEIAKNSINTESVNDLFDIVKSELGKVIDTSNLYIALHNPETDMLRVINSAANQATRVSEWKAENSLSGHILNLKEGLLLKGKEIQEYALKHNLKLAPKPAICWLGVPLIDKQRAVGILVIKSYSDENAYDKNSVRLIEMIAHELSSVLQRGKMIMDLIAAKEKAEESDKLKSAFLANISHEIRTPMNGILGFLELLSNHDITDDEREKFMEMVNKSSLRLMGTINDIVEISKIESGKIDINYTPVNLSEVMDYYKDLYWHKTQSKGIELVLGRCIRGELANISTDRFKLDGIITNLLNNAIKFTHSGQVEFGNYYLDPAGNDPNAASAASDSNSAPAGNDSNCASVASDSISASAASDSNSAPAGNDSNSASAASNSNSAPAGKYGGSVVFYVKDTGIGIPKDKQEAIFGRFIQASHEISNLYEGSGLGLSIVKAYIDALNGKIWVESELGKGSTFYVSIPV